MTASEFERARDLEFSIKFVNRIEELRFFESQINGMASNYEPIKLITNFWGTVGIGKSWLLRKLYLQSKERKLPSFFFDFRSLADASNNSVPSLELFLQEFIREVGGHLFGYRRSPTKRDSEGELKQSATFKKQKALFQRLIGFLESTEVVPMVLFFDSLQFCSEDVFRWIEKNFFPPLLRSKKVIIIVASRRPLYWHKLDVRQMVVEKELLPFDLEGMLEQLEGKNSSNWPLAEVMSGLSFGHPGASQQIAGSLRRKAKGVNLDGTSLNKIVPQLLHREVKYIFEQSAHKLDAELKFVLCAISPLRWFDYALLRQVLIVVKPQKYKTLNALGFRDLTRELEATTLIQWNPQFKGFSMDLTIRRILNLYMETRNLDTVSVINVVAANWFKTMLSEADSSYIVDLIYYRAAQKRYEDALNELDAYLMYLRDTGLPAIEIISSTEKVIRELDNDPSIISMIPVERLQQFRSSLLLFRNNIEERIEVSV